MLHDELLKFHGDAVTATLSTGQSSGALDIRGGTAGGHALFAEVRYNSGSASVASGKATFVTEESDVSGSGFSPVGTRSVDLGNGTANAVQGIVYVPVVTSKRYVRLSSTVTGTTGTITYTADLVTGKPV